MAVAVLLNGLLAGETRGGFALSGYAQFNQDQVFCDTFGHSTLLPDLRVWYRLDRQFECFLEISYLGAEGASDAGDGASARQYFLALGPALLLWPQQRVSLRVRAGAAKVWLTEDGPHTSLSANVFGYLVAFDGRCRIDSDFYATAGLTYLGLRKALNGFVIHPGGWRTGLGAEFTF
jgi:hypothetical protein